MSLRNSQDTRLPGISLLTLRKQADAPYTPAIAPEQAAINEQLKAETLRRLAQAGLGFGGLSAGVAGLLGLRQMLVKPHVPKVKQLADDDIELTVPTKKADWAESVVKNVMPTSADTARPSILSPEWFMGNTQKNPMAMPWVPLAGLTAIGGGTLAGHSLVKWLAERKRKGDIDADVASAKKEYEDALHGMYGKKAEALPLDEVYAQLEKKGIFDELAGTGAGLYALLAAGLGAGSGALVYKHLKERQKSRALEEAVKMRARAGAMSTPPELYLRLNSQNQPPME